LIHEERSSAREVTTGYDEKSALVEEESKRGIEQLPARLQRYAAARSRTLEQVAYLREFLPDPFTSKRGEGAELRHLANELEECGRYLGFKHFFTINELRLHVAHFCQKDKLCGLCQIRRASKILRLYAEKFSQLLFADPSLIGCMVTPTVRDGPDLGERLRHLLTSHSKCINARKHVQHGYGSTQWARAVAGVSRVEIKRGSGSGQWHPHIHSAWLCHQLPDEDELRREWERVTGDSHQVKVSPLKFSELGLPPTPENVAADLVECLKYSVKLSEMNVEDAFFVHDNTRGVKLLRPFGLLHGLKVPKDLLDDPLSESDLPYVEIFFRYAGGKFIDA
jgi:hypothetical protein